jgi:hypothetical protein
MNTIITCMNLKVCIKHLFIFNAAIAIQGSVHFCTKGDLHLAFGFGSTHKWNWDSSSGSGSSK